jgi:hypothetical protein
MRQLGNWAIGQLGNWAIGRLGKASGGWQREAGKEMELIADR